jgi:hypothetical protein
VNRRAFLLPLLLAGCGNREAAAPITTGPEPSATAVASAPAPLAPAAPPADPKLGKPCGPLECRLFDAPEDAFAVVLASKPLALGMGEAHAQKGMEGVDSSAKRFTEKLLPALRGRASDLVVELMLPPKGCAKPAAEKQVRAEQREVTKHQAEGNQNEYLAMNEAARKVSIVPDALRPSCADLEAAAKAGDGAVPKMLETIARLAGEKGAELVAKNQKAGADKVVVLYGGALHNDAEPRPERAAWSFGPALQKATAGRYADLDLFVPESIQDTESWKAMPWYPHYDRAAHGGATVLFKTGPASWVMIFPKTAR